MMIPWTILLNVFVFFSPEKREDPVTLMVRYLAVIGMRIIDVFRMFDTENRGYVKKDNFIKGLKVQCRNSKEHHLNLDTN